MNNRLVSFILLLHLIGGPPTNEQWTKNTKTTDLDSSLAVYPYTRHLSFHVCFLFCHKGNTFPVY